MEEKGGYLAELGVMTPSHILDALTDIKWMGSGEELRSVDPHTNEILWKIKMNSTKEMGKGTEELFCSAPKWLFSAKFLLL